MLEKAHITICASSRFYAQAEQIYLDLVKQNINVYTPRFDYNEENRNVSPEEKFRLTTDFLEKVRRSSAIYIVNPGGYVGMSVALEAGFAYSQGIDIFSLDRPSEPAVEALVTKIASPDEVVKSCSK